MVNRNNVTYYIFFNTGSYVECEQKPTKSAFFLRSLYTIWREVGRRELEYLRRAVVSVYSS